MAAVTATFAAGVTFLAGALACFAAGAAAGTSGNSVGCGDSPVTSLATAAAAAKVREASAAARAFVGDISVPSLKSQPARRRKSIVG